MMDRLAEIKGVIKRLEGEAKELEEVIRPALVGRGELVYNGYSFNCKEVAGRKTLDKEAVEAAGIDLEPFMKVGRPYTTLTIKSVNEL